MRDIASLYHVRAAALEVLRRMAGHSQQSVQHLVPYQLTLHLVEVGQDDAIARRRPVSRYFAVIVGGNCRRIRDFVELDRGE